MATPCKEPLINSCLPAHPWETVAADLFKLNGTSYLLVSDYFSRFSEVVKLNSTNSMAIPLALKTIFSLHGIPSVLRSDNGPQFVSTEMKQFAESYSFMQITSSPKYPQSNGLVERMVQTVKGLLNNSTDSYMALLSYRATPLPWCKLSPYGEKSENRHTSNFRAAQTYLALFDHFSRKRQRVQATTEETV